MRKKSKNVISYCLITLTGILIAAAGIMFDQSPLRMLPLFVSLIISYLQSKVSRYASLIGGINSLLYAAVYAYYHLYASMVYAVLISCPLQIITFVRWQKNRWQGTTRFRSLSWKQRGGIAAGFLLVWAGLFAVLKLIGSDYALFDNTITLFGILISFLTMFACIEYTVLMIPNSVISTMMYAVMLSEKPEQMTFLIYSVYCLICQCIAFMNARRAYREQQGSTD